MYQTTASTPITKALKGGGAWTRTQRPVCPAAYSKQQKVAYSKQQKVEASQVPIEMSKSASQWIHAVGCHSADVRDLK